MLRLVSRVECTEVQSIFNTIGVWEQLRLRDLYILEDDLSSLPPELLVQDISRLERVELEGSLLSPSQTREIFRLVKRICLGASLSCLGLSLSFNQSFIIKREFLTQRRSGL